jgi:hypothetical protein
LWLTDYVIAENLRLAYESQVAAYAGQAPPPPDAQSAAALTPEMKALIDDEVRQQIAAERVASGAQPASGTEQMPPALTQTYFVVSASLDIPAIACSLTPGDLIQRTGNGVTAEGGVTVAVVSSKPGDCVPGSSAAVQLADLQNMQNQFRENIDAGLKMLADNQARGLPNGPPAGARPVAEGTASPAPDAATQLTQQEAEATNLEAQVRKAGGGN